MQLARGTYLEPSNASSKHRFRKFESLKVIHTQKPQIKKCFSTGPQSPNPSRPESPTRAHLSSKSQGARQAFSSSSRFIPRRSFLDPNNELLSSAKSKQESAKQIALITAANEDINAKPKTPTLSSAFLFEKNAREAHGGHTSNIGNREIHNFIALSTQRISFQNVWAFVLLTAHTYNFITFFFFLGNRGFPERFWLFVEVLVELLLLFDFCLRFMIRKVDRNTWRTLWLLHQLKAVKCYNVLLNCLASLPQSLIILLALHDDPDTLHLFGIALLRGLKLTRMRQVSTYFKNINLVNKRKKASYASSFFVMYFLLLATHVISMAWMVAGRLEREKPTWYELVNLGDAPLYQQYVDSTFFVVATMTGLGYGNIVPRTIVEYLTVLVIMIVGASIYANFFANFAVTIYNNNAKQIENAKKLEQAKGFANRRGLEEPLKAKIRYYYNHLSIKFGSLQKRYDLLKELPLSLRTELALYTNADLIQSVKLFQLSEPGFILTMARELNPCLCLAGDYVLHTGELAEDMYFIKKGVVVVLAAPDETQIIAYQSVGEYFGEIGVLLDGKRTAAVKALTTSIFYRIRKSPLLNILDRFAFQKRFLLAVAKQRMETSTVEDIEEDFERQDTPQWEEGENRVGGEEGGALRPRGKRDSQQFLMQEKELISDFAPTPRRRKDGPDFMGTFTKGRTVRAREMIQSSVFARGKKIKCHLTKRYVDLNYFIVIPLSRLFYLWSVLLCLSFLYNLFYVPFSIAFQVQMEGWFLILDLLAVIIYALDIPLRLKLAYNSKTNSVDTDLKEVKTLYYARSLIWDLLAVLPLDYFLYVLYIADQLGPHYAAWARLLRLIKYWRFNECIALTMNLSNWKLPQWIIIKLVFFYIVISHLMGCFYYLVGRVEYERQPRYDGQTMFQDINNRQFVNNMPLYLDQSVAQRYVHLVYLSACTMGACIYGDIIPLALYEQLYTFVTMFTARIFLAFLYAEAASYLIRIHSSYSTHLKKLHNMKKWMRYHKISHTIIARVARYQQILWNNYKGIDEETILADLPNTVKNETAFYLFKELVDNTHIFPKDDKGSILTLMSRLKLKIYPKDEYIIREGDIGKEMFFILKGKVSVLIKGKQVAVLTKGMALGEMALIGEVRTVRSASAKCISTVSCGILQLQDFRIIEKNYPRFREHIEKVVEMRRRENEKLKEDSRAGDETTPSSMRRRISLIPQRVVTVKEEKSLFSRQVKSAKQKYSFGEDDETHDEERKTLFDVPSPSVRREKKFHLGVRKSLAPNRNEPEMVVEELEEEFSDSKEDESLRKKEEKVQEDEKAEEEEEPKEKRFRQLEKLKEDRRRSQAFSEGSSDSKRNSILLGILEDDPLKYIKRRMTQQSGRKPSTENPSPRSGMDTLEIKSQTRKSSADRFNFDERSDIMEYGSILTKAIVEEETKKGSVSPNTSIMVNSPHKKRKMKVGRIFQIALLPLVIYNLIWTPLQFAYRLKYEGIFLAMEIITILAYLVHLLFHMYVFMKASKREHSVREDDGSSQNLAGSNKYTFRRALTRTLSTVIITAPKSRLGSLRLKMSMDIIAVLPFGVIFQSLEVNEPLLLIALIKLLRISKLSPLYRSMQYLKSKAVNIFRIVEVVLVYYICCHIVNCIWIMVGKWAADLNNSWIRRIPVPLPDGAGHRVIGANTDDLSMGTVYAHGLMWTVNTISHVAIGDVTAVTVSERVLNALVILCGTFLYALLFGNIAAMVADFAPQLFYQFQEKYQYVLSKIPSNRVDERVRNRIKEYFDYQWNTQQGIDDSFIEKLPRQLRTDILLSRFQHAIHQSIIFQSDEAFDPQTPGLNIDYTITASIFKVLKFKHFMKNDFIMEAGSHGSSTVIVLEGKAAVFGIDGRLIGYLHPGCHYNTDCAENQFKRRLVHIVACSMVTLGVLSKTDRQELLTVYSFWKPRIELIESMLYLKAKSVIEKIAEQQAGLNPRSLKDLRWVLEESYAFATQDSKQRMIMLITGHDRDDLDFTYNILENLRLAMYEAYTASVVEQVPLTAKQSAQRLRKLIHGGSALDPLFQGRNYSALTRGNTKNQQGFTQSDQIMIHKRTCFRNRFFSPFSSTRQCIDVVHIFFILYTAISLPFQVGFRVPISPALLTAEVLVFLENIFYIVINLRTAVIHRNGISRNCKQIFAAYHENGFWPDAIGVVPLNIALMWLDHSTSPPQDSPSPLLVSAIIGIFRLSRMVQVWRMPRLLGRFELVHRGVSSFIQVTKVILFLFFLWHWTSCMLFWISAVVEYNWDSVWLKEEGLAQGASLARQYLMSIYFVMNIVSSVGYGDMYARNDLQRIFVVFMMNLGDALFAVAFGLLAAITMNRSKQSDADQFFNKMKDVQQFIESFPVEPQQQARIEQFFAYKWTASRETQPNLFQELGPYLPTQLVREVTFQATGHLLRPIFARFNSENLIRDLSSVLHYSAFLPGDYVIYENEVIDEMYFVAEGSIDLIASDKLTVLETLKKGAYFGGQVGLVEEKPGERLWYAQASSYSSVYILTKKELDKIVRSNYPFVIKEIEREARQKYLKLMQRAPDDKSKLVRGLLKDMSQMVDKKRGSLAAFEPGKMEGLDLREINNLDESLRGELGSRKSHRSFHPSNQSLTSELVREHSAKHIREEDKSPNSSGDEDLEPVDEQTSYDSDEHSDDFFTPEQEEERDKFVRSMNTPEGLYTQGSLQNPRRSQFSQELEQLIEQSGVNTPMSHRSSGKPAEPPSDTLGELQGAPLTQSPRPSGSPGQTTPVRLKRRLSEVSLGKQLMLSQAAGLQLQWTIALKNNNPGH